MAEKVYIANFGRENYEWPVCLKHSTIATMNSEIAHTYWENEDREGYIEAAIQEVKTAKGLAPTTSVASRWYNLMRIVRDTEDDYWVHKDGNNIWWTKSTAQPLTITLKEDPKPLKGARNVYVAHKPCLPWSRQSLTGKPLRWDGLHRKAQDFLSTEATLQQLSEEYALYTKALLKGEELKYWHKLDFWKKSQELASKAPVTYSSAIQMAVWRMCDTSFETVSGSNGQKALRNVKEKRMDFTRAELIKYIEKLFELQEGLCAITNLKLQLDGQFENAELLPSLDRIDSNGHYSPGNIQIVCRFINRWKGADDDQAFRNLLSLVN